MMVAPRPRGRPRAGEDRSEVRIAEITDAAARLFTERGYDSTSMQDVGEAVGMRKGSLYQYLDSREDLLFWVLRRNHEQLHAHASAALEGVPTPGAGIAAVVGAHVGHVLDNAALSALYAQRFTTLERHPAMRAEILALRRGYEGLLVDLLVRGQSSGEVAPDLDPALTARSLLAMCNAAHLWAHPGGPAGRDAVVAHHVRLTTRAVAPQAARRP